MQEQSKAYRNCKRGKGKKYKMSRGIHSGGGIYSGRCEKSASGCACRFDKRQRRSFPRPHIMGGIEIPRHLPGGMRINYDSAKKAHCAGDIVKAPLFYTNGGLKSTQEKHNAAMRENTGGCIQYTFAL